MTNTINTEITFELSGATYTRKANGYCFVTYQYSESGTKNIRIGKAEFESKYAQYQMMDQTLAEIEASEAHESVQDVEDAPEAVSAPKAKKKASRAKKNAAFAMTVGETEITLTEKQVDFIRHLPDTCFWEDGLDSCIWVDVLCDEIGGQFEGKPMTVGAMISTICEKGLGSRGTDRRNGRKVTCFALTGMGKVVAKALGLR